MALNQTVKFLLPFRFGDCRRYKHTHKQTNPHTGPITIHCAVKLSAQCKNSFPNGNSSKFPIKLCLKVSSYR